MMMSALPAQDGSSAEPGLYLYGIVRAGARLPEALVGVVATTPHLHEDDGGLAAVVSDLPDDADFGTPQDLLAHSTVLDEIARTTTVLPARFGTVLPSGQAVHEEVLADPERLAETLNSLEGAVQYTVRVRYEQDVVLPEILRADPRLALLREEIAGTTEDETRTQRIALGEAVVGHYEAMRGPDAQELLDALEPLVRDVATHEGGQADDVVDVALLVPRENTERFEAAVEAAAERHHPRMKYRLLGPQAPYDFVDGGQ
ncbi:hypothetical protein GCM10009626_06410 [Brachybacterium sacelli]